MVMLASKMPRLRLHAAQRLHTSAALLLADPIRPWERAEMTTLRGILGAHDWSDDSMKRVKQARQQVIGVLGLSAPVARRATAESMSRGRACAKQAADEGYQGLLNDVARGL